MGETSKHASSKRKRKEHRLTEKALARDGSDRLAEAAKKREASEAAARKAEAECVGGGETASFSKSRPITWPG